MAKKYLITITEERNPRPGFKIFDISLARHWLGVVVYDTFDLRVFNQSGYLLRFINNFRPADKTAYILFSSFAGLHGASESNIDKVLDMAYSYVVLKPLPQEKSTGNYPNFVYCVVLKDGLENIGKIFDYIDSIETHFDLIFAQKQDKEYIFSKIKELHTNNSLNQQGLLGLKFEMIDLRYGKYGIEEGFRIITQRFDINQIKDILLNSIEPEKFKVVIK